MSRAGGRKGGPGGGGERGERAVRASSARDDAGSGGREDQRDIGTFDDDVAAAVSAQVS